jgi:hypothetical protein
LSIALSAATGATLVVLGLLATHRAALLDLNVRMSETDPKNSLEIKTPPIHIAAGPQRISAAFIPTRFP